MYGRTLDAFQHVPQAEGGEWKDELMFKVPREHPEVERLEGRYKK